jgi:putative NADPH-quinone reductase
MKTYVVYCHPDPESFTAAVHQRAVDALQSAGHDVRVSDLYADGFEPTMPLDEVVNHLGPPEDKPAVAAYCDNLTWCEALVFIYPTWWSGQPAMLTGWLDRVLIRGVAWELPDGATRITPRLTNVHRLVAITMHGSSKLINIVEGETGRRVIGRALRVLCHRSARTTWLAMYNMDRSSAADREAFLSSVERRLAGL